MAKIKKAAFNLGLTIFLSILAVVLGLAVGLFAPLYVAQGYFTQNISTDELIIASDNNSNVNHADFDVEHADLSIHFLELGNKYTGDCTLIKAGNTELLIDCGSKASSVEPVKNYLDTYVTDGKIEYVIVTHAHQDHYAGFATSENIKSIFDYYQIGTIITFAKTNQKETATLYKNFKRELSEAESRGTTVLTADNCYNTATHTSKTFDLSTESKFEILYNPYYYTKSSGENNHSVCCMVTNGSHNFLFTGDLEKDGEEALAEQYKQDKNLGTDGYVEVDLYKAGHHGSKTSSHSKFLEVFRPQICCVCCCAGSPEYTSTAANQFPTQEFINRIAPYTTEVYVTTLCVDYANNEFTSFNGNIIVGLMGGTVSIQCSNNNTKLKDSEWFKANRTCPAAWASTAWIK